MTFALGMLIGFYLGVGAMYARAVLISCADDPAWCASRFSLAFVVLQVFLAWPICVRYSDD